MFLPIQHESRNLMKIKEKQKCMWEQLHSRMDQRQREWKMEMEELKKHFFKGASLSPSNTLQRNASLSCQSLSSNEIIALPAPTFVTPFYHEFDMKHFQPEEISVRTHNNKLLLEASHRELDENKLVSREFKRELDIPPPIDPQSLQCSLTLDGRLVITGHQIFSFKDNAFQEQISSPSTCLEIAASGEDERAGHGTKKLYKDCISCSEDAPEWPLPDVVENHFVCGETSTEIFKTSPPKYSSICSREVNVDACIKSIHSHDRPFYVNVDLGKIVEPTQLKIDSVDKILLVRVFMYDSQGHTRVWKIHIPHGLDPSDVAAHLTNEGHLILEEN